MRLRNKKTGEIIDIYKGEVTLHYNQGRKTIHFKSLEELEDWEDYEPKGSALDVMILTLTNFIENEPDEDKVDLDDCRQMLEKLMAWKRLKDKGFRFEGWDNTDRSTIHHFSLFVVIEDLESINKDLDLLFGGEE